VAVGAGDAELTVGELDVRLRRFELVAAIFLVLAITFSIAPLTALPPTGSEREPPVPRPKLTASVSPWWKRMLSSGMPSPSATSWA